MNWAFDYIQKEKVLRMTTSGAINDAGENQRAMSEGLAEANRCGTTKFLVDNRRLTKVLQPGDIYYLPEIFKTIGLTRQHQVAIVLLPSAMENVDWDFYQMRLANTGYSHRLFTDVDSALGWLAEQSAQETKEHIPTS